MCNSKRVAIVGGGFLGALAALLLSQDETMHVILIENQPVLGGLYSNAWTQDGYHFDFGARVLLPTHNTELDNLLTQILPASDYYYWTESLKEFSYQNGKGCEHSNCLDARLLGHDVYERGLDEFLGISDQTLLNKEYSNLRERSLAVYGATFTEHLIAPAMKKLTGHDLANLDETALHFHALNRIIVVDRERAIGLKQESVFNDARVAFAKHDDHASTLLKIYPKSKGFGDFGARLKTYMESKDNITLKLNNSVTDIGMELDEIKSLKLKNKEAIEIDHLLWTVSPIFLCKILGVDLSQFSMPAFRDTALLHYIFEGDINTGAQFYYNYDPDFRVFRTTFYDNFCERPTSFNSATAEVFVCEDDLGVDVLSDEIFDEMKRTGAISSSSKIVKRKSQIFRRNFPSLSVDFYPSQTLINTHLEKKLRNVRLSGRANSKHHTTPLASLLQQFYEEISPLR